ncbi:MAG: hypothetical protein ABIJ45_12425 [Candidatus Zixiibacteriota bacterium]
MYQRGMIPRFGLFIVAALVLFIGGCSDDSSTSSQTYDEGSLSDPYFVNLQMQIEDYLTDARIDFNRGLDNIYQLPTDTAEARAQHNAAGPNDTVTAAYMNGWHVTYIARYNLAYNDRFRDSVQFREGGVVVEEPTAALDYQHYVREWGFTDNNVSQPHTDKTGEFNFEFENLDSTIATLNGTHNAFFEWNWVSNDSTVRAEFDIKSTVSDITFGRAYGSQWSSGCPYTGTMEMTIKESYRVVEGTDPGLYSVDDWTVTAQFNDGVASITVIQNNYRWQYELTVCE